MFGMAVRSSLISFTVSHIDLVGKLDWFFTTLKYRHTRSLPATFALPLIFFLALSNGLVLHIFWPVSATAGQWIDVIYHVPLARPLARSRGWAGMLMFKLYLC